VARYLPARRTAHVAEADSWYYDFEWSVSAPASDSAQYKLVMDKKFPLFKAYRTKRLTMHSLVGEPLSAPLASISHPIVGVESNCQRRALSVHTFGDSFASGGSLQISERVTLEDPFHLVSVTHAAIKTPLFTVRENLLFEVSGSLEVADGELMVFRILCSMPTDTFDNSDLVPSLGFDTCHIRGGMHAMLLLRGSHGGTWADLKGLMRVKLGGKAHA
jgi:hypothetical protein